MSFKVYLAGAITGISTSEANEWRLHAEKIFKSYDMKDIKIINPVMFYNYDIFNELDITEKEIKDFDLNAVLNSNVILVNLAYPKSIGTAIEIELAARKGIPIIAYNGSKDVHPWIDLNITKYCNGIFTAIEYIMMYYYQTY